MIKGTTDAAAQLQAAKTLQALLALLHAHKHAARRGEVRCVRHHPTAAACMHAQPRTPH